MLRFDFPGERVANSLKPGSGSKFLKNHNFLDNLCPPQDLLNKKNNIILNFKLLIANRFFITKIKK